MLLTRRFGALRIHDFALWPGKKKPNIRAVEDAEATEAPQKRTAPEATRETTRTTAQAAGSAATTMEQTESMGSEDDQQRPAA